MLGTFTRANTPILQLSKDLARSKLFIFQKCSDKPRIALKLFIFNIDMAKSSMVKESRH